MANHGAGDQSAMPCQLPFPVDALQEIVIADAVAPDKVDRFIR